VQEDGGRVSGRLPAPGGLGIRRTALTRVLAERAAAAGASLRWNCRVQDVARTPAGWRLATTAGPLDACLLVAADGLHSPLRHRAGLVGRPARRHRFGLRGHYRLRPWSDEVEVHLRPGLEAFVTPVGSDRVGLAFLWERGRAPAFEGGRLALPALLANYPQLAARLGDARLEGAPRGAGPLAQRATACVADRLVLLGDAAGYVDAITGEGLSLAFAGAAVLAAVAPDALARGADADALRPYARAHARLYRRYALVTGAVLGVARRPRLRRPLLRWLARRPTRLETLIRWGLG
jgi:flavin-dependent dehydrogenase